MPLVDQPLRTIKCDNQPDCNKEITFDRRQEKEVFEANPWLKSIRLVQTVDQRNLVYCSDVCEIAGAKSGTHNLPVPKKIIEAGNTALVNAAAAAAAAAKASDEALKSGSGGPVIVP
jgi:hypothetical protein